MSATLLLVEDHPLFREGFTGMLQVREPNWMVRSADCAAGAMACAANYEIDLIIVDAGLPDLDGFSLLRRFGQHHPKSLLMLISAREDMGALMRARDCGARGFLSKRETPDVMVARIRQVLEGGTAFGPEEIHLPTLTERQRQILELLAEGHGNKEIRHRLSIAERTVRAHLTDLFQMLGAQGRVQALLRARELGLIA